MVSGKRNMRIAAAALAVLFSWYWCTITFFAHMHEVDGVRIVHSHPFTGSSASHTHSAGQMQTISFLSYLVAAAVSAGVSLVIPVCRRFIFAPVSSSRKNNVEYSLLSLRAPPALRSVM